MNKTMDHTEPERELDADAASAAISKVFAMRRVFADITEERARQERLKAEGKFLYTCADPWMQPFEKVAVLGEEFGEVCCAALNQAKLATDGADRANLRHELVQVAAVAVAWIQAIDEASR